MTRHYSRAGEEAKAKAVDSLPSFLGSENTVQTDKSVTAEPSCIPDISALPAEDLKRLIEAAAAEMQRRNKVG
jgi:hypothetical protein